MQYIKILIVDDHPIVVQGLRYLLQDVKEVHVVESFHEGLPVIPYIMQHEVDIILLDVTLPDINGIELCAKIKAVNKNIKILGLSNHNEHSIVAQMLEHGANGYLLKNASVDELVDAIKATMTKGVYFSSEVQQLLLQSYNKNFNAPPIITRREKEILGLISEGKTTSEIAEGLFISTSTVETHRKNLMQKFEVNNVASMIKKATTLKMI
jgi:DNA-binding NarL/FixJ family response regulator